MIKQIIVETLYHHWYDKIVTWHDVIDAPISGGKLASGTQALYRASDRIILSSFLWVKMRESRSFASWDGAFGPCRKFT